MDFIWGVLALLFIHVLDGIFYKFLAAAYQIFLAVSRINIFATEGGMKVFSTVSTQLYTIIGIAMIFVFAYQLVLLIINPEGGNQKSPSKLFFDTVVSVFVVLVLPTIFNYMTVFQDHVLTNGTIPAILLGTGAAEDIGEDSGYKIALMVMTSFYHPNNSDYTTFYGEDGKLKSSSDAVDACKQNGDDESICQTYYDALKDFDDNKTISSITGSSTLSKAIYKDETMTYMWVLSTAGAICVTWFLTAYAIDIGTRAVKLGFLQLIAPIPVILRIFPQSRKSFEVWFDEIKKTYVEVFLRLAVIFFAVRLIQLIPALINSVFTSTSASGDGIIIKCIATVLLILGLLKFAQEAPELVKTMFSTGGNWMKGLNFSPSHRKHIEDNKLGMAGIGAAAGMIGGFWGGAQNARRTAAQRAGESEGSWGKHIGAGIFGGLRGAMTGAVHGAKNAPKELTRESMRKNQDASTIAAQESYNKGTWLEKVIRAGQDAHAEGNSRWKAMYDKGTGMYDKGREKFDKERADRKAFYQGTTMSGSQLSQVLGNVGTVLGGSTSTIASDAVLSKMKKDYDSNKAKVEAAQASELQSLKTVNLEEMRRLQAEGQATLSSFGTKDGKTFEISAQFDQSSLSKIVGANGQPMVSDPKLAEYLSTKSAAEQRAFIADLQKGMTKSVTVSRSAGDTGAFKSEVAEAAKKYADTKTELDSKIAAMQAAHDKSIAEMQAAHKTSLDTMKSTYEDAVSKRKEDLYKDNEAVRKAFLGSMAKLHDDFEKHGHQMSASIAAFDKVIQSDEFQNGCLKGTGITSYEELTDQLSKTNAVIPAEIDKLIDALKNEASLQNSAAFLQEKQAAAEDKK